MVRFRAPLPNDLLKRSAMLKQSAIDTARESEQCDRHRNLTTYSKQQLKPSNKPWKSNAKGRRQRQIAEQELQLIGQLRDKAHGDLNEQQAYLKNKIDSPDGKSASVLSFPAT